MAVTYQELPWVVLALALGVAGWALWLVAILVALASPANAVTLWFNALGEIGWETVLITGIALVSLYATIQALD